MEVGEIRQRRANRVHDDELAALLLHLLDELNRVDIRRRLVYTPGDIEVGVHVLLGIDSEVVSIRVGNGGGSRRGADIAHKLRRAQLIEEAMRHRIILNQAQVARIAVGHHGLGAELIDRLLDLLHHQGIGIIPGNALEGTFPLRAGAAHGIEHAIGMVHPVDIVVHLHAGSTRRDGIVRISGDGHDFSVDHLGDQRARVVAVARARIVLENRVALLSSLFAGRGQIALFLPVRLRRAARRPRDSHSRGSPRHGNELASIEHVFHTLPLSLLSVRFLTGALYYIFKIV